jgi:hypothetical protein
LLDRVRASTQHFNDRLELERLSFAERYAIGRLDVCFLLEVIGPTDGMEDAVVCPMPLKDRRYLCIRVKEARYLLGSESGGVRGVREQFPQQVSGEICNLPRENQKAMFIAGIKPMQPAEYLIPARVGLQFAYRLDDICSGEMYLSAFDFSLKVFRLSNEWEHKFPWMCSPIAGHSVNGEIKSRAEVMDRISDNERPFLGNGFLAFTGDDILSGLWLMLDDQPIWSFLHERANFPIKVVDVIFGPLNFEARREGERISGGEAHCKIRSNKRTGISKNGAGVPAHETEAAQAAREAQACAAATLRNNMGYK